MSTSMPPASIAQPQGHVDRFGWRRRLRQLRAFSLYFVPYLAAAISLQWVSGIYGSELGHHPDEPAHVTTALMIHDYLASRIGTSPVKYAEMYYVHYPKVGFGMWPPVFHTVAAIWMLLFTSARVSLILFMAVQCAVLALALALFARRFLPGAVAFGIGLLFVFLPLIQSVTTTFMVDLLLALLELCAMLLIVDFFDTERRTPAILFGVITALAMLTKGNANALILVPLILVGLTRKFYLLRRPPLYIAAAIIVLLGGPWQIVSLWFLGKAVPMARIDAAYFIHMLGGYVELLFKHLGGALFALAVVGIVAEAGPLIVYGTGGSKRSIGIAGAFSLLTAVVLFHSIAPNPGPDERYMVPAMPMLLFFCGLGVRWLAALLPVPRLALALIAGLALLLFARNTFAVPPRPELGFARAAGALPPQSEVVLVCSDSIGEGAFVTAVALSEPRPRRIVLRGSKTLSENTWDLKTYRPLFKSSTELQSFLETTVDAVVIDLSTSMWEQDRSLLQQSIRENPQKWQLSISETSPYRNLLVYKRLGGPLLPGRTIRVRMRITLGRDLELRR